MGARLNNLNLVSTLTHENVNTHVFFVELEAIATNRDNFISNSV
jgi:hypothetical protein